MGQMGGVWFREQSVSTNALPAVSRAFAGFGLSQSSSCHYGGAGSPHRSPYFFSDEQTTRDTDMARASIPYHDAKHGLTIIADARIDAQSALLDALGTPPDLELNDDDRRLILSAYRKWGEDCPIHLIGDYAFAIWDETKRHLFCARDHIGVRPFFIQNRADRLTFGSDIRLLLAASPETCELDENYVAHSQLCGGHYSTHQTFYETVEKLPPGHHLTIRSEGSKLTRYWDPRKVQPLKLPNDEAYLEALRSLLDQAVADRLRSYRRVGVHISGGLDSSAIASTATHQLASRNKAKPLGLSWQPPPDDNKPVGLEHWLINAMKDALGLDVRYIVPNADGIYEMFMRDGTREPSGKTLLQEEFVQQYAATQGVDVILSGWGGDQSVSYNGRSYYPELFFSGQWIKLYKSLRHFGFKTPKAIVMQAVLPVIAPGLLYIYADWRSGRRFQPRKNRNFIHPGFAARMRPKLPARYPFRSVRKSQIHQLDDGDITRRIEDWTANARPYDIEYRYPLLDRRLTEFALAIPSHLFRRGKWNRWIFRNAFRDRLPEEVCWNPIQAEVERYDALVIPFAKAVTKVRNQLRSGELHTTRAAYVDIDRLIAETDPDSFHPATRFGMIDNAIRFLDFTNVSGALNANQDASPKPAAAE